MKYSIVMVSTAPSILTKTALNSIHKNLNFDELIIIDHGIAKNAPHGGLQHGIGLHKGILQARNNIILILDNDIIIRNGSLVERMLDAIQEDNVFSCGPFEYFLQWPSTMFNVLLAPVLMINKRLYLDNGIPFDHTNAPTMRMMVKGIKEGQKAIHVPPTIEGKYFNARWNGPTFADEFVHLLKGHDRTYNTTREQYLNFSRKFPDIEKYIVDNLEWVDVEQMAYMILLRLKQPKVREFSFFQIDEKLLDFILSNKTAESPVYKELKNNLLCFMCSEKANTITNALLYRANIFKGIFNDTSLIKKTKHLFELYPQLGRKETVLPEQMYLTLCNNIEIFFNLFGVISTHKCLYIGTDTSAKKIESLGGFNFKNINFIFIKDTDVPEVIINETNKILNTINEKDYTFIFHNGCLIGKYLQTKWLKSKILDVGDLFETNTNSRAKKLVREIKGSPLYELVKNP